MNHLTFALRGFLHNWKINVALILGVAAGTAVLVGALLVGDSVRGSLLKLTIDRLGKIDSILLADHFFEQGFSDRIKSQPDFATSLAAAIPVIILSNASSDHRFVDPITMPEGFRVREVHSSVRLEDLAAADKALAGENVTETLSFLRVRFIDYFQGTRTGDGFFKYNEAFPGAGVDNFVIEARGTMQVIQPGTYTFGVSSNDAARLEIDGNVLFADAERHTATDPPLLATIKLTKGDHEIKMVMFDRTSNAGAELFFSKGTKTAVDVDFVLLGDDKPESLSRAARVTVIGCGKEFWEQDDTQLTGFEMQGRTVVLNQPLADQLKATVGDKITLRVGGGTAIAADSPLANRDDITRSLVDLSVSHIIPADGLGRFSLNPSQHLPRNAYVPLEVLQEALDQDQKVNAVLIANSHSKGKSSERSDDVLKNAVRPSLADAGLVWKEVHREFLDESQNESKTAYRYFSLSTNRMVFPTEASEAIEKALQGTESQPVFTYLANSIESLKSKVTIPYSTISAVDSTTELGPLFGVDGKPIDRLADNEIMLNSWAAEDLGASVGDRLRISFFEPETTHGETKERTEEFLLRAVVPLAKPLIPYTRREAAKYVEAPGWANDPDLTPTVPGITDQASIDDWDPPFPFDHAKIRKPKDEDYWDNYRTTPKAFVSLATGQRLWSSRFGQITSYRVAVNQKGQQAIASNLETAIAEHLPAFGFSLIRSKRDGIAAASGTTPFNVLFLLFSFFIVVASLALISLLFRLGVEQRAPELGMLMSVGLSRQQVGRLTLLEGVFSGTAGALLGSLIGIGYALLLIIGLRTWWVEAVTTPFLEPHFRISSLLIGCLLGLAVSALTILATLFGLRRATVQQLVTANFENARTGRGKRYQVVRIAFLVAVVLAISSALIGIRLSGEAQAGAFFATGACVLTALLLRTRQWLQSKIAPTHVPVTAGFSSLDLVIRNVARNTGRSVLTIGLMAAACFLIIAISAFRLAPTSEGTGDFEFVATSELPIFADLNSPQVRDDLFGTNADKLAGTTILPLRFQDGEDASCRNLYQSQRPRLLGITNEFMRYAESNPEMGFRWSASSSERKVDPWRLLDPTFAADSEPIPVVLDKNTALYSLHLYGGIGEVFELDYGLGAKTQFRVVGLLSNSVLQGSLLIGERDLVRLFPRVGGYRYFLIDAPGSLASIRGQLEETFRDEGFEATDSSELLRDLLAVQNTYLSTFQSLGGLGLLLGTFGLVAVQLRNVWQRRGEIALLRATGFSRRRVGQCIFLEHGFLLLAGLGIGTISALLTVLPHVVFGGASLPLSATIWMLLLIVTIGLATGWLAVRDSSRLPILRTLRGS